MNDHSLFVKPAGLPARCACCRSTSTAAGSLGRQPSPEWEIAFVVAEAIMVEWRLPHSFAPDLPADGGGATM
jgi:hypothetical protein